VGQPATVAKQNVSCPNCGQSYGVPVSGPARAYRCHVCKEVFEVGQVATPARVEEAERPVVRPEPPARAISREEEVTPLAVALTAALLSWVFFDRGYFVSFSRLLPLLLCLGVGGTMGLVSQEWRSTGNACLVGTFVLAVVIGLGGHHAATVAAEKEAIERPAKEAARKAELAAYEEARKNESALTLAEALAVHQIVNEKTMGAREQYSQIRVNPIEWRMLPLKEKELILWRLGQARLRRFGCERVEIIDGYSGKRLGGFWGGEPYVEAE
jgi:hypothetical protein